MSRGLLKTLWLAATAVFGSMTTSSRCLPKNIMRKNIIILNSILKQNILIMIQKHCRSMGSASWEWVRSWPRKLSQTAPSVPRLVSLICYSSLCWYSSSSSWWISSLYWFIFILMVICVIFDGHGYIIFTVTSFLILAIIFMKNMAFSLAIGCIGNGHSVVFVRSWWGSYFWPKKKRWVSNSWDLDLRPPNFATSRGQKNC